MSYNNNLLVTGMIKKFGLDGFVKVLLLCGWIVLFVGGIIQYTGSWLTYTVFSLVFFAMLISGFYRQVSYGYLFLVVMLWLGFWLKLTVHLLVIYPFGEPVGLFVGTPGAWDDALWIASIGSAAVVIARLLYAFTGCTSSMLARIDVLNTPTWYAETRRWVWAGVVFVCVGVAVINASMGIQQSGLVAHTILLWPLNAVTYWLLGSGFAFAIAVLLWWDISLGRDISLVVHFILLEAFTSTISLLSRGIYIFMVVPQFIALYKNRQIMSEWSRASVLAVGSMFVLLFAISNPLVNTLRDYYYSGVAPMWSFEGSGASSGASSGAIVLAKFAVDRWVGVEGVMAVSAYPQKGGELFARMLTERGEIGKFTFYQEICLSHYRLMDMSKFQFASLPGVVAFLYLTGVWWIVFVGMVVLVLAVLGSENLVFKLTGNPLLCALCGGAAANSVAQMGIAPRGLLIYFFEMVCGIVTIYFIQSEYFHLVLQKLGVLKNVKNGS